MPEAPAREGLRLYLRILSYLRPYTRSIVLILVFNLLFVAFNALSIWMVAPFINTLFKGSTTHTTTATLPAQSAPAVVVADPTQSAYDPAAQHPEAVSTPGVSSSATPIRTGFSVQHLNAWMRETTDSLILRGDPLDVLKLLCILIFLAFLLKNFFSFAEAYTVSYVEQRVIKDLREQIHDHMLGLPLGFFSKNQTGSLMSRVINDVNSLNVALNRSFTKVIRDPIVIIVFVILLFSISWRLTLLALVVIPVSGLLIQRIGQSLKRKSRRVQERIAEMTSTLQESLSGIKVIKAFTMEEFAAGKFSGRVGEHFRAVLRQVRMNRLSSPLSETIGVGILVSVLWVGGHQVLSGRSIDPEDFIRFIVILFSVMAPIKSLAELNNNVQIALASGVRVFEIIDTPPGIADKPAAVAKVRFERNILYESVSFCYSDDSGLVLEGVDLGIEKNQRVALVGSSGAGKTSLVNLLPRFYEVSAGNVKIDGVDVRDLRLRDLRGLMGIVSQDVFLFNDTVASNIACGETGHSITNLERAGRLANAHDFIMRLPDGYDTMIGERGMRLSGGERQRLSIARAFFKNPPILIFDEATSSLDSESESQIQEAIEKLMKDRTVLIIAHRLSSVIHADKIVVLDAGRIIDEGTHLVLLGRCAKYRQFYELQLLGSE
jgi:subfamily B ATP-binding cassette protein MsbA